MGKKTMNLMKDGWHYKDCTVIFVEYGKVTKRFTPQYKDKIFGVILVYPVVAWNTDETWWNVKNTFYRQMNDLQLIEELKKMPHKCRARLMKEKTR